MLKKKDNLTDFVEKLPKVEVSQTPEPAKNQQVVDNEGELITLSNKNRENGDLRIYKKSFELQRVIKETIEKELEKMEEKIIKAVKYA
jgi:hypothetical protein